jgi:hypothetical protein
MLVEVLALIADVLDDPVVSLACDTGVSGGRDDISALAMRLVDIVEAVERDLEAAAAGALVTTVSQLRVDQECASFTATRPGSRPEHPPLSALRHSLNQARVRITRWLDSRNAPPFVQTASNGSEELDAYLKGGLTELVLALEQLDRAVGVITPLTREVLHLVVSQVVADACRRYGQRSVLELLVALAAAQRPASSVLWPAR